uniref:Uncharacterized protein LOC113794783 n=1 Tax=Dermatophagoides pteronyssinus TaxID=6956 RepID=A0A6P6Y5F0_DERPT|nr:uncharacterized protein LOC113794783 [Dermatophagoides pteronyssinus]
MERTKGFLMKKTAIFCYTSISIIIALVLFVCVVVSYDDLDDVLQKAHEQHPEIPVVYDKRMVFLYISSMCGVQIAFSLIGLLGALDECYALSVIYLALTFLDLMSSIALTAFHPFLGWHVAANVIVLLISCSFIKDLRKLMRQQQSINPSDSVE